MRARWWRRGHLGFADESLHFAMRTLMHLHFITTRRDDVREQEVPPGSRASGAMWNAGKKDFESRTWGIRQHQRSVKAARAQSPRNTDDTVPLREGNDLIDGGMPLPQRRQLRRSKQRDVRARQSFAQAQQRRRAHHRVAEPVDAAHQETFGSGGHAFSGNRSGARNR